MKTKWVKVPVSERYPKKEGNYMVKDIYNNHITIAYFQSNIGFFGSSSVIKAVYWLEEVIDNEEDNIKKAIAFGYNTGYYNGRNKEDYSRPDNGKDYDEFISELK